MSKSTKNQQTNSLLTAWTNLSNKLADAWIVARPHDRLIGRHWLFSHESSENAHVRMKIIYCRLRSSEGKVHSDVRQSHNLVRKNVDHWPLKPHIRDPCAFFISSAPKLSTCGLNGYRCRSNCSMSRYNWWSPVIRKQHGTTLG